MSSSSPEPIAVRSPSENCVRIRELGYIVGKHVNPVSYTHLDVYKRQVLVGYAQIELRVVLDRDLEQTRERGDRSDGVVVLELRLLAVLVFQRVVVELGPAWLAVAGINKR